jgi:hypothetical protein
LAACLWEFSEGPAPSSGRTPRSFFLKVDLHDPWGRRALAPKLWLRGPWERRHEDPQHSTHCGHENNDPMSGCVDGKCVGVSLATPRVESAVSSKLDDDALFIHQYVGSVPAKVFGSWDVGHRPVCVPYALAPTSVVVRDAFVLFADQMFPFVRWRKRWKPNTLTSNCRCRCRCRCRAGVSLRATRNHFPEGVATMSTSRRKQGFVGVGGKAVAVAVAVASVGAGMPNAS